MEAWNNYRKANTLWYTGWGLFSVGIPAVTAGTMTWLLSSATQKGDERICRMELPSGNM